MSKSAEERAETKVAHNHAGETRIDVSARVAEQMARARFIDGVFYRLTDEGELEVWPVLKLDRLARLVS